jgi:photosystem II Psb27 protein
MHACVGHPPAAACCSARVQTAVLASVNSVLALARDDPTKEESVKVLRKDINTWVANYRRQPVVSGRPSFG